MAIAPLAVPSAKALRAPLRNITETLAAEFDRPTERPPEWNELEWRLARAVASMHGVSSLLPTVLRWSGPGDFFRFLAEQREHTKRRHASITELVERIGARSAAAGIAVQVLKGGALHDLGIYQAGERPMADLDLLVHESNVGASTQLLEKLGYRETCVTWKHRAFEPSAGSATARLGEHAANPIKIDLHTKIAELLPWRSTDITAFVLPAAPRAGLNPYPSSGALLLHLLLHAAGNMVSNALRLVQLCDIARLAPRLTAADWDEVAVRGTNARGLPWALPPLRITARYFPSTVPPRVIASLQSGCPWAMHHAGQRQLLSDVSFSNPFVAAAPGLWWSQSVADMIGYLWARIGDSRTSEFQFAGSELWASESDWYRMSQVRRVLRWATSHPSRVQTMQSVRAALLRTQ
jgi:putative nucleotidyltransferase-like protein